MKSKAIPAVGATLSVLLLLGFAFTVNADTFLVPDDFPTIQAAVDAANPAGGDIVMVGPGDYAGAVITNPVKIVGSGDDTRITSGTYFPGEDAFILYGSLFNVDGTEISNLVIEYEGLAWGVYGESADNVTISNVTIKNAYLAIDNWYGNGWTIVHNTVNGLRAPDGITDVVAAGIRAFGTSSNNLIAHNYIHHEGDAATSDPATEIWGGIGLVSFGDPLGNMNNNIHHNQVQVSVPDVACFNFVLADYGAWLFGLPVYMVDNMLHHNLSWGECAGLSFFPEDVSEYTKYHHNQWEN